MLTVQGSFLLATSVVVTILGVLIQIDGLSWIGLATLLWLIVHWLTFEYAVFRLPRFMESIERTINSESAATLTSTTDRNLAICWKANVGLLVHGVRVALQEVVPDTMQIRGRMNVVVDSGSGTLLADKDRWLHHRFEVSTPICGRVEFPGIQVELSDQLGLFRTDKFAALPQVLTVLPFLIRPQTTVSVLKHNNLQRHLGHHRHRSSGISSELHGIRDYRPGDPPRTIAWKPTARLGRVMTCEFENEVPVRATLLIDLALYQFDGRPGPTAGDRAISTAASIAKLLLADRDPVAAVFLSDFTNQRISHGTGERQLSKLLQHLMFYSNPNPPLHHFATADLVQVVFENATRRFPELFDERFNQGRTHFRWIRWSKAGEDRMRHALSLVLEHLFSLPVGLANRMQFDDQELRKYCLAYVRRFNVVSAATTVPIEPPYQDFGQWLRARNDTTLAMCEQLTQVRSRAKDNELFVLVAPEPHDLLGCEMIEAAVKQTIAAGHRVMYVAPERPVIMGIVEDTTAASIIMKYSTDRHRRADSELGHRLRVIGSSLSRIDDPRLMQLVATEVGILQSATSRSRTTRTRR